MRFSMILIVSSILVTASGSHGKVYLSTATIERDCEVLSTEDTDLWVDRADRCVFLEDVPCRARKQSVVSKRSIDECLIERRECHDKGASANLIIQSMSRKDSTLLFHEGPRKATASYLYKAQSCSDLIRLYWQIYDPKGANESDAVLLLRNGLTARLLKQYLMGEKIAIDELYEIVFVNLFLNRKNHTAQKMYLFFLWWVTKIDANSLNIDIDAVREISDPSLQAQYEHIWSIGPIEAFEEIAAPALAFGDIACPSCWEWRTENEIIAHEIERLETQLANGRVLSDRQAQVQENDARWLLSRLP